MTEHLKNENIHFLNKFEEALDNYLLLQGHSSLADSIKYSLKSHGKRFRPFLAYLVLQTQSKSFEVIKSWCLAIEFIHTYSLIHDDLPCMDNDNYRRGVLTNHKVYGEDIALLAGDSLISEAFRVVAEDISLDANIRLKLIQMLATKIGPSGMVGGQLLDMQTSIPLPINELKDLHVLKTGNLIQAAAQGAGIILQLPAQQLEAIENYALQLGLAFQIKDDLLDYKTDSQDFKNYVQNLGLDRAQSELEMHSASATEWIQKNINSENLVALVQFNLKRTS